MDVYIFKNNRFFDFHGQGSAEFKKGSAYLLITKTHYFGLYDCGLIIRNNDDKVEFFEDFTTVAIEGDVWEKYIDDDGSSPFYLSKIVKNKENNVLFYSLVNSDNSYYALLNVFTRSYSISLLKNIRDISVLRSKNKDVTPSQELFKTLCDNSRRAYAYNKGYEILYSGNRHEYLLKTAIETLSIPVIQNGYRHDIKLNFTHGELGTIPINIFIGKNGTGKSYSIRKISEEYIRAKNPTLIESVNKLIIISNTIHDRYISTLASYPKSGSLELDSGYEYFSTILGKKFSLELGVQRINLVFAIEAILKRDLREDRLFDFSEIFEKSIKRNLDCTAIRFEYSNGVIIKNISEAVGLARAFAANEFRDTHLIKVEFEYKNEILSLSSGQKNYIDMMAYIVSTIENNSMIFIDELENFLHPNMIIESLRVLKDLLLRLNSICVIATHSLFIAREIPSSGVSVFIKEYQSNEIYSVHPDFETYSCSLQKISSFVFGNGSENNIFSEKITEISRKYTSKQNLFDDLDGKVPEEILLSISDKMK